MGGQEIERNGETYDPFRIFYNKIRGIDLRISGIGWDEGSNAISSFEPLREFFERQIPASKCVVMEFSPARSEYVTTADYTEALKRALTKTDIKPYNWGVQKGLRELCEKYQKKVFTVDPICTLLAVIDKAIALEGVPTASILFSDLLVTKLACERKLSRRHFLQLLLTIALTYPIIGTTTGASFIGSVENLKNSFLRGSIYGTDDFRNIAIAQGLQLIPPMVDQEEGDYVFYIGGWTHARPIDVYLSKAETREKKARFYRKNLGKWFRNNVREYACNNGEWVKVGEKPFDL